MSAPAANALSLPVMTIAPMPGSASNAANACTSSAASASFSAFIRCGRLRRMRPDAIAGLDDDVGVAHFDSSAQRRPFYGAAREFVAFAAGFAPATTGFTPRSAGTVAFSPSAKAFAYIGGNRLAAVRFVPISSNRASAGDRPTGACNRQPWEATVDGTKRGDGRRSRMSMGATSQGSRASQVIPDNTARTIVAGRRAGASLSPSATTEIEWNH